MFLKIFVIDGILYLTTPEGNVVSQGSADNTVFDIITGFVGSVDETTSGVRRISIATQKSSDGNGDAGWYSASQFSNDKQLPALEKGQFVTHICKASPDFVKDDGTVKRQGVSKAGFALPKLGGGSGGKVTPPTITKHITQQPAEPTAVEPEQPAADF